MMNHPLPLRSRAATYLLIPGIILAWLYANAGGFPSDSDGYWVGVISSATAFTLFSCGLGALAAAIDGGRIRQSRLMSLAPARSALEIAFVNIWPTVLMAMIIQISGFLFVLPRAWGAPGRFPWEVLVAWLSMILLHIMVGYLLGLAMPIVLAAPLALLFSYSWLGFPWALSYVPLRYLSGLAISGCCAVYSQLDSRGVAAVILFSLAFVVAALILIASLSVEGRRKIVNVALSTVILVAGVTAGLATATGVGNYPSLPRDATDLVCTKTDVAEICFYPEQLWSSGDTLIPVVEESLTNLQKAGWATPKRVSGSLAEMGDRDTLTMLYRAEFNEQTIIHSLSSWFGYSSNEQTCARDSDAIEVKHLISQTITNLAFISATEGSPDPLINDPRVQDITEQVLKFLLADRNIWVSDALKALNGCEYHFPDIPEQSQ